MISKDGKSVTVKTFKERLGVLFDDNLATPLPRVKNVVDYIIIGLILISTLEVFLSTFSDIAERYRPVLNFIDILTVILFTIEIALRIWSADELDERYKGFWGRVRYCLTFYGLIDLISVVPFYINLLLPTPYMALKIFRVFRLLRLFRYMSTSILLFEAVSSKRKELTVSLTFLVLLTVILSALLFFVEHDAQPEQCENGWSTFVWAFAKYLGDPGKIADFTLETPAANFIAFIVGLLGIAIFAVPTGLISSGFTEALEERKRKEELASFRQRMKKAFRRFGDSTFRGYLKEQPDGGGEKFAKMNFVPQRVKIAKMQVRQGMDLKDIVDTCREFPEFRLKNLADARTNENEADDCFVVEHFPKNTLYGCCVENHSRVTIVCTSSFDELGIGWFTYYLAKMGGFNYVSKDVEVDPDELDSYYNFAKEALYNKKPKSYYDQNKSINKSEKKEIYKVLEKKKEHRDLFLADVKRLADGDGSWVIVFTEHIKNSVNKIDFHIVDKQSKGDSTVSDQHTFMLFYEQFAKLMNEKFGLCSQLCAERYLLKKSFLGTTIRDTLPNTNVFVLRPSSVLMNFDAKKLVYAYEMALLISRLFDGGRGIKDDDVKDFKATGFGYIEKSKNNKKIK